MNHKLRFRQEITRGKRFDENSVNTPGGIVVETKRAYETLLFFSLSRSRMKKLLQKVELGSTLCNMLLQLATPKFVMRQVEHAVVIRATTRSTCNATMLRDKLNKNVAGITRP